MTITSKFQTGEEIKFNGEHYKITRRFAKVDLDAGLKYASISYDLKSIPWGKNLYNITESEIIEDIRLANLIK